MSQECQFSYISGVFSSTLTNGIHAVRDLVPSFVHPSPHHCLSRTCITISDTISSPAADPTRNTIHGPYLAFPRPTYPDFLSCIPEQTNEYRPNRPNRHVSENLSENVSLKATSIFNHTHTHTHTSGLPCAKRNNPSTQLPLTSLHYSCPSTGAPGGRSPQQPTSNGRLSYVGTRP